jgi:hypothetical protein
MVRMSSRIPSRVLARNVVRVAMMCAISVGLFFSCRTVDDETVDGAETYQATLSDIGAAYKIPQTAQWRIASDSGEAGLYHTGQKVIAWVDLDTVPRDTVWIEYWRAGVREQRSAFLFTGTARLEWSGLSVMDSLVVEILRRIDPSADSSRFDTAFARALVDNDSIVRRYGFPKRFPVGLDTAEVLRIAMVLMVRKELALAEIVPESDWALGIDTLAVHVRVRSLCEEGVVTDTSKIFPHPKLPQDTGEAKPDTSKTPIDTLSSVERPDTLAPDLRIVEPAAGAVFESSRDSIEVHVQASDTSGVDSVKVNHRLAVRRDSFWVVEKVFVPTLPDSLVLLAEAWDGAKNRASASVRVRRNAPLPEEPYHAILLPVGSTVPFDSTSVLARWIVYDPTSVVDSVRIGGIQAVYEKDSIWSARVRLDAIGTPTTIRFVATTSKGTSIVDSTKITRLKDATGPSIRILSPTDKQVFEYTVDSVTIILEVSDPSGVASVDIGGVSVPDSNGRYQRRVGLRMDETATFAIDAHDSMENRSSASVTVTRKAPPDTLPSLIQRVWPEAQTGTRIPFDSQSVTLRWKITDLHGLLDTSVRIAGTVVEGVRDTFALRVALPPNGLAQEFQVTVVNAKGVPSSETVSVTRDKDTVPPVVVRKAGSRTVPFDSVSVVASWQVTDNHRLSSVAINGVETPGVGGIHQRSIALDTGRNLLVLVAKDSTGNQSVDTVEVVRVWKDTTPPVIVRGEGTQSREVDYDSESVTVSWKVTDDSPVTVVIGGEEVDGRDGVYTAIVQLSAGTVTVITIEARDTTDNTSADTVIVTKSADTTKPEITHTLETLSRTVDYQTDSIWVGWRVEDNGVLRLVYIDGERVDYSPTDSAYMRKVPLEVGDNVIRVKAMDQAENWAYDSIVVHRAEASASTGFQVGSAPAVRISERDTRPMFRLPWARREKSFG